MNFARRVIIHPGNRPMMARVAILLIWQPAGLPHSIRLTIESLRECGFCTVVVSNSPLLPEALQTLSCLASVVLERPNFGYDFGGYRDGIRFVFESVSNVETLLLLNDSTWFPLRAEDDTLGRLIRDPTPYKGLVNKQVVHKPRHRKHLESHFLMFEQPVLRHPSFHKFWKNYQVSSDRYNTIWRGEYGISDAITSAGFPMAGLIDPVKFMSAIDQLSPIELSEVLENFVAPSAARSQEVFLALQDKTDSEDWRARAAAMISDQIWREEHLITTAYIFAGLRYMDFPYLKKRKEPIVTGARLKALEMLDRRIIPAFSPEVEREVRISV